MNDRFEIIVLNRPGEIFLTFVDVESSMKFFCRATHLNNFSVFAHKGNHSLYVDRVDDVKELVKKLNALAFLQPQT